MSDEALDQSRERHVKDTAWTVAAYGGRLVLQGGYFFLLAGVLGPDNLGLFAGTAALICALVPFCGWGGAELICRHTPRDRTLFPDYLGTAIILAAASGAAFFLIGLVIGPLVLGHRFEWHLFIYVAVAEMLVFRVVETTAKSFEAVDRFDLAARVQLAAGVQRLVALGLYVFVVGRSASVASFALCYLLGSVCSAAYSLLLAKRHLGHLGRPRFSMALTKRSLGEGFTFSLGVTATSVYTDIDKTLLARFAAPDVGGLYTAAYRIVALASTPLTAVVTASRNRMLRRAHAAGDGGVDEVNRISTELLKIVLVGGVLAGIGLYLTAPLLPMLIGAKYAGSIPMIRWLAVLPLVGGVHFLYGEALMAVGKQGVRASFQALLAGVNVLVNLWLIRRMSWEGAVFAAYAAQGLLAVAMLALTSRMLSGRNSGAAEVEAAGPLIPHAAGASSNPTGLVFNEV
jgi:O-antigen/teichoic acid export membrane protein